MDIDSNRVNQIMKVKFSFYKPDLCHSALRVFNIVFFSDPRGVIQIEAEGAQFRATC
jgi:hypothetical protein